MRTWEYFTIQFIRGISHTPTENSLNGEVIALARIPELGEHIAIEPNRPDFIVFKILHSDGSCKVYARNGPESSSLSKYVELTLESPV